MNLTIIKFLIILFVGVGLGIGFMYDVYLKKMQSIHVEELYKELAHIDLFLKTEKPVSLDDRKLNLKYILDAIERGFEHPFRGCTKEMIELFEKAHELGLKTPSCS